MNKIIKHTELKKLSAIIAVFLVCYYLPVGNVRFTNAISEALYLVKWYAQEHVLLCLLPAFFIAGAVGIFISQGAVIKYMGTGSNKFIAYLVAALSGTILAVCSCTILPLFSGIYRRGAGLGPAVAFLYSGPAINILAIILTARLLGTELGIARAIGAILFSIIIGLIMSFIFRKEESAKTDAELKIPNDYKGRTLPQSLLFFFSMICILIFANFAKTPDSSGFLLFCHSNKWIITSIFSAIFAISLVWGFKIKIWKVVTSAIIIAILAFTTSVTPTILFLLGIIALSLISITNDGEMNEWLGESWWYAKMIMPLLLIGVIIAGLLLGQPNGEGLIPSKWIINAVGGNSLTSNLFASIAGAFMYFATLTEIPILQGLISKGMGKGPALALLLAGPALSLPNMLVIRNVMGTKKTSVYVLLVIIMATISGVIYGNLSFVV